MTDWTDYDDTYVVVESDFRYVKIRLTGASTGGDDLLGIDGYRVLLDLKLRRDAGSATANSGDTGGTQVDFNVEFIDVRSITVTPKGFAPARARGLKLGVELLIRTFEAVRARAD